MHSGIVASLQLIVRDDPFQALCLDPICQVMKETICFVYSKHMRNCSPGLFNDLKMSLVVNRVAAG